MLYILDIDCASDLKRKMKKSMGKEGREGGWACITCFHLLGRNVRKYSSSLKVAATPEGGYAGKARKAKDSLKQTKWTV